MGKNENDVRKTRKRKSMSLKNTSVSLDHTRIYLRRLL